MSVINLTVNGRTHTVDVDPATPLLYVLSDDLALRGPKFGCGLGQCGACTVIVKGRAIRSCVDAGADRGGRRDHDARRAGHRREAASDSAGVHRRAGGAVRLLPERRHPDREGVPRSEPEGDRRADPAGDVGRAVPLLRAHADAARRSSGTRRRAEQEDGMKDQAPHRAGVRGGDRALSPTPKPPSESRITAARFPQRLRRAHRRVQRGAASRAIRPGAGRRFRRRGSTVPAARSSTRGSPSPPTAASRPTPASASSVRACTPRRRS